MEQISSDYTEPSNAKAERAAFLRKRSKDHNDSIKEAKLKNQREGREGQIRVAQLPGSKSKDKCWPNREGFHNVNVSSSSSLFWQMLSPFFMGPYIYKVNPFCPHQDYKN